MHFLVILETALILFSLVVSFIHYDATEGLNEVPSFMPSLWVSIIAIALIINKII